MTGKVLRSVKKKHNLWKKFRYSQEDTDYVKYKKQENKASKLVRSAKREFEKKIAQNIKKDPKSFYKYVKSKSVGPLVDDNGSLVSDDRHMGDLLNNFLHSVFTV